MIQIADYTASLRESKSVRKDLRMKPSVVAAIERASTCVGMDTSTFIASAAYDAAQKVEKAQFRTSLSDEDFDTFASAVDRPGRRNEALGHLLKLRSELLTDD
ncbi:DUF1778 domain-containing protein [Planktotalea lamellibrachiae]|nr:DUF1778 domain-containing protein [Aliiroseovarius lamellibrachiae]